MGTMVAVVGRCQLQSLGRQQLLGILASWKGLLCRLQPAVGTVSWPPRLERPLVRGLPADSRVLVRG